MPEPGNWEPWWSGVSRCALLRPECEVFPFLTSGTWFLSSFAGLEGEGLKCTRGGARGDWPLSGRLCRFAVSLLTVSTVICLASACEAQLMHSICFEHFVDVSNHLTCLSALDSLFGACWTALHVVGVSLFCEAGERCVSGLAFGTRQLWWPWVACLAVAWEAFESVHYIFECLGLQCVDISIDGQWYGVRHFGFRGSVSLGAWSTWRGPWAAGRPEWRVNADCVDVYIQELDARGA